MPEKYQDEIEEILRKVGEVAPSDPPQERERADDRGLSPVRAGRQAPVPDSIRRWRLPRFSPGKLMLAGLAIFIIGAFVWTPGVWIGLGILVLAYLLFFVKPRSISIEKRWRGRPVEDYQSPWEHVKRWLKSG
jgi:hypothetical protein